MKHSVLSRHAALAIVLAAHWWAPMDARAAAGTTCLCRTLNGTGFEETTVRHSRWACDHALGYVNNSANNLSKDRPRPQNQTCNRQEIIQFKVWRCLQAGCTYPFAVETTRPNERLKQIETLEGQRRP